MKNQVTSILLIWHGGHSNKAHLHDSFQCKLCLQKESKSTLSDVQELPPSVHWWTHHAFCACSLLYLVCLLNTRFFTSWLFNLNLCSNVFSKSVILGPEVSITAHLQCRRVSPHRESFALRRAGILGCSKAACQHWLTFIFSIVKPTVGKSREPLSKPSGESIP